MKGKENLIPGGHKITDEERRKGHETRRINSSMRKMALKFRGLPWTEEKDVAMMEYFGIPVSQQTLGNWIVLRAGLGAAAGNKDDRRDFMRMTGDDPDVAAKETELKLKQAQAEQADRPDNTASDAWQGVLGQILEVMGDDAADD